MKMDPEISIWLNIAYTILTGITAPALQAAGIAHASQVVGIAALIAMPLNIILHAFSSAAPGPLAKQDRPPPMPPRADKMMLFLVACLLGVALTFGSPEAAKAGLLPHAPHPKQMKIWWHPPRPKALVTPDQIIAKVLNWATTDGDADLAAAILVAKANNDNVTLPCWMALQTFVKGVEALPAVDKLPKLHLAVDVEILTDLMIALQPNAPTVTQCQALANFQKMSAINMVTGIVTGALSLGKLAPIIPIP
ncbi:MAG: hypothetical protein ACYC5H_12115 [Methylovirgula sp.]